MPYDMNSHLWPNLEDIFFRNQELRALSQIGPHCVSTSLAILTGANPEDFQGIVNTQDPISWSEKIKEWDMQLAYCPTDARKLRFYIPELLELDDLFTLSYYLDEDAILEDPDDDGWICGSHIVVMHRDKIIDPEGGLVIRAEEHPCNNYHTKRIFRVVPTGYYRSL